MARKTAFSRELYYDAVDTPFILAEPPYVSRELRKVLTDYKSKQLDIFPDCQKPNLNEISRVFRETPETLINLTLRIAEKIPLSNVYNWTIEQVCRWLRGYGYPQYQAAFRINMISGRFLLVLDASALSAMNIKDFDHIRRITYGIRCLFNFEMTKFGRSISLPPEYMRELYKLLRIKNGTKYDRTKASDFWRRLQIIRPNNAYMVHWEILERWLKLEHNVVERVGGIHRYELYKCRKMEEIVLDEEKEVEKPCNCMPPCECYWTERQTKNPWLLNGVSEKEYKEHKIDESILSVLRQQFPERYKPKRKLLQNGFVDTRTKSISLN